MQSRRRTHLSAALLCLAAAPLLSGCSEIIGACSAVGWTNTVDVQFTASPEAIASVQTVEVCGAGTCWEAPRPLATPTTPAGASEAYEGPTLEVTETRWTLPLDMETPESITVTARSGDGTVLGTADSDVNWTRVGGTARCGGPAHAGIVDLTLAP